MGNPGTSRFGAPHLACAIATILLAIGLFSAAPTARAQSTSGTDSLSTRHATGTPAAAVCGFDRAAYRREAPIGINLAGPSFGPDRLPGLHGRDYIYPDEASLDAWHRQGVRLVRLTFQWERMQPQLRGDLASDEVGRLTAFIAAAHRRGMTVITGPHNYARYNIDGRTILIGNRKVPVTAFADFWRRLAAVLRQQPGIFGYALMNEPHDTGGTWKDTAQAALDAIRQVDGGSLVIVPGDAWSGAWKWDRHNADLLLRDPADCLMYEAHQYFDANGSGTHKLGYDGERAYPRIGIDRAKPFLDWLDRHGQVGIITEFGIPRDDPRWLEVLSGFLTHIRQAGVGGTAWAAGPWWGPYPLSIEPKDGQPAPAMSVLAPHFKRRGS